VEPVQEDRVASVIEPFTRRGAGARTRGSELEGFEETGRPSVGSVGGGGCRRLSRDAISGVLVESVFPISCLFMLPAFRKLPCRGPDPSFELKGRFAFSPPVDFHTPLSPISNRASLLPVFGPRRVWVAWFSLPPFVITLLKGELPFEFVCDPVRACELRPPPEEDRERENAILRGDGAPELVDIL